MSLSKELALYQSTAQALDAYDPRQYLLLNMPALPPGSDAWHVSITPLPIDVNDPEQVYNTPGRPGHVSLHAVPLRDIAHRAGVVLSPVRFLVHTEDIRTATVNAAVLTAPHQWRTAPGTYTLDIPARCDELRLSAESRKDETKRQSAIAELPGLQLRTRRFADSLAETGAINRALRALLNVRNSYPKALLAKCPLVIPRLVWSPTSQAMQIVQALLSQAPPTTEQPAILELARQVLDSTIAGPAGSLPPPEAPDLPANGGKPLNDWHDDNDVLGKIEACLANSELTIESACKLLAIEDLSQFPGDPNDFWYRLGAALAK